MDLDSTLTGPVVHEPFGRSLPKGLGSLYLLSSHHAAKWCWKSWHDMLNYFRRFFWGSCRFVDLELARKQHAEIGHRDTWDELQEPGGYSCLEKIRVNREIGSWIQISFEFVGHESLSSRHDPFAKVQQRFSQLRWWRSQRKNGWRRRTSTLNFVRWPLADL